LFWRGADGKPYQTFAALARDLKSKGKSLQFAMNGGMYQDDFQPVGLYVENGRELTRANTVTLTGAPSAIPNFFKKPNGVFYIANGVAGILETGRFLAERPEANFATQSGPMLIIDGAIHPAFIVSSTDRKMRNGVGVTSPTQVHFVITKERVSFYEFARFSATASAAGMRSFSTEAWRLGSMRRDSAAMTPPAMAAMGLSSQWWTRATKLRMIRRNVSVSPAGDLCSSAAPTY
ncbi:MAG: phosphodiester glycosidase family protein, partial [Pseudolabrys sp.]